MTRARLIGVGLLAGSVAIGVWAWQWQSAEPPSIEQIRQTLDKKEFSLALSLAEQHINLNPAAAEARLLAADACRELGRFDEAVKYLDKIPDDNSPRAVDARWKAAWIDYVDLQQPAEAEQELRRLLAQDRRHVNARMQLASILGFSGRNREAAELRFNLLKDGVFDVDALVKLALGPFVVESADLLDQQKATVPRDPLMRAAFAYDVMRKGYLDRASELFRQLLTERPDVMDWQAALGTLVFDDGADEPFFLWHSALPTQAESHPAIWRIRGDFAHRRNELSAAARCYWEAVRRDPLDRETLHRLGQALRESGDAQRAQPFEEKAAQLLALHSEMRRFNQHADQNTAIVIARLCQQAGLLWDAWGWTVAANQTAVDPRARRLPAHPDPSLPRMDPATNPALLVDLSSLPLPDWIDAASVSRSPQSAGVPKPDLLHQSEVSFVEEAVSAGVEFTHFSGDNLDTPEQLSFQWVGGGVAVLDYDQDGWPDLYFTQGSEFPNPLRANPVADGLFRNQGGTHFEQVAEQAGIHDTGYGQGVTVGDYNSDGFADLFVANLDGPRLYCNNGDGTFSDVTDESGVISDEWATSCLLADLNRDGNPDLYLVNYLGAEGNDIYQHICRSPSGVPISCGPRGFSIPVAAARDAVWLSRGDGRFEDVTAAAGFDVPDGAGLGIVAFDADRSGRLNLFVANDGEANFWFVNRDPGEGTTIRVEEAGVVTGLAFNREGISEACMGIAADDADGDGRIDLFVTNYYDESNTLYVQQADESFLDLTQNAGLVAPSLKMLGFGSQFLDADLDSWPDLIVTNGHVDFAPEAGVPRDMPPQFFRNLGEARFVEHRPETVGPWFAGAYRGRGLATLDWNRDGRPEFAVSHVDAPAALLRNTTQAAGHYLAVRLVATGSARDAIGTTVTVSTGRRSIVRQLTAGDGYLASNQRQLLFGLAEWTQARTLEIHWPSGRSDKWKDVAADREYLCVEGDTRLLPLPR